MTQIDSNSSQSDDVDAVAQEGVVTKITEDIITVALKSNSNCEGCRAKAACGVSESNSKEIEITNTNQPVCLNENVNIFLKKGLGMKAVFWAYLFPFILMISVLIITSSFLKEWLSGVLAIAILIPYYFTLYVLKHVFGKVFKVSILKFN